MLRTNNTPKDPIAALADNVMRGVVSAGVIRNTGGDDDNVAAAVEIMRDEIKAFIAGDRYADERECLRNGSLHEGYVLGAIVANCVSRIADADERPAA